MSNLELTYQGFIGRISEAGRKDFLFTAFGKILIVLAMFAAIALVIISTEAFFEFSSSVRKILYWAFCSGLFASSVIILIETILSYRKASSPAVINSYAGKIGSHYPEVRDNLLNALQIYSDAKSRSHIFSADLVAENLRVIDLNTRKFDFTKIVSAANLKKHLLMFVSAAAVIALLFAAFPNTFYASANRLVNYEFTYVENTLGISFEVTPGNINITKGDAVELAAKIKFNDPAYKTEQITIVTRNVSDEGIELSENSEKLTATTLNEFKKRVGDINSNTSYYFEYKGIKSSEYKITVTARPVIKNVKITLYPPAYTKLPSRVVEGTEITAIVGSRIYVELQASDNLTKALLQFRGGGSTPLEVNGSSVSGSFTAMSTGLFNFSIIKELNGTELAGSMPKDYSLNVIADQYPKITIVEPANDYTLKGESQIIVRSRVSDDFGFTKLRLGYKISKSKYGMTDKDFRYTDIPIQNTDATGLEVPYVWNLSKLNLGTEDEVEYFVEVYDNDAVSGPKMSKSELRKLIYPSLESMLQKTEKTKDEIENSLKSAYDDAMDLKKEMDELKEKLERNPEELGLNDPKKQQELQNKIENIQNQFSETQKKMEDMMQDLQNNNQISKETLDKYMELQKMFQSIDSKELREMLKKLQEAMKNMNNDQLKEAMKNFKFDEENFKKSLEKTMELLNKILNEQKFGELTQKLDEITKKQDEVKDQTKKTDESNKNKLDELSKSQEQLKKEYEDFMKKMKELTENMKKQKDDKMSKELEKLMNEMMKKKMEQKMKDAADNMQNSQKNSAEQKQDQLSEDLNDANQKMQDMLAQMMEQENSKTTEKLQQIMAKLKEMSKKQGELKDESKDLKKKPDSDEYKRQQQEQNNLQNKLSKAIDEMMGMSQEIGPQPMLGKNLGDAYNEMDKASDNLGKKDADGANKSQGNAKDALDKAIEKLNQMCQNGQGKSGKSGNSMQQLMQALQQMIAKQQGLNGKMGEMGQNGNQGNMSQEQMAQMQKLGMEQQTIQKNLQQLNEEFKKQQELDGKKMLGNLDEVQKDMMEVIKDLQNNNITPETKKRQEKILSRMLDFQLSQREKDFEQKRESRPGKNFERSSPPEVVISRPNIIDGINRDALDLQKESYSDDYEMLIQKYRESLKRQSNQK